jgi:hypothetical protein
MEIDEIAEKAATIIVDDLFNLEEFRRIAESQGAFWLQGLAGRWKGLIKVVPVVKTTDRGVIS